MGVGGEIILEQSHLRAPGDNEQIRENKTSKNRFKLLYTIQYIHN